jgi:hypothetical protein
MRIEVGRVEVDFVKRGPGDLGMQDYLWAGAVIR